MRFPLLPISLAFLSLCPLTDAHSAGLVAPSVPSAQTPAGDAGEARALAGARAAGQRGLDGLMAVNKELIDRMRSGATPLSDPAAAKLRTTLDAVAKQRDAHASGLYWHTDLEAAKAEAKASGKRILSLRLLGNLDEEFSCANSRFFRTALYANKNVSDYLRENFVLHWKSVRPAPKLTIDMGDGRRIERTITGNSIHYVLNPNGYVLDAIPGLYGPAYFNLALHATEPEFGGIPGLDPAAAPRGAEPFYSAIKAGVITDQTEKALTKYHGEAANSICHRWLTDAVKVGIFGQEAAREWEAKGGRELIPRLLPMAFPSRSGVAEPANGALVLPLMVPAEPNHTPPAQKPAELPAKSRKPTTAPKSDALQKAALPNRKPSAEAAERRTVGKRMVEEPILRRSIPEGESSETASDDPASGKSLPARMTPAFWKKLADLISRETHLDEASRRFMMSKLPDDAVRRDERGSGRFIDPNTPFAHTLLNFEAAMAEDTVRNEYLFHSQIHQWLEKPVTGPALARDVEALNKKVYAELFLTPDHDAWLGLVPENVYTALEKNGCACDAMRGTR